MMKKNFYREKITFHVRRFLAMRGMNSPLKSGLPADYWERQDLNSTHGPHNYLAVDNVTKLVLDDFIGMYADDASFIEIGCNSGRNLNYLLDHGFTNLAGMEINRVAIEDIMPHHFPDLGRCGTFFIGNSATEITKIPDRSYDVVFSIAVLIHIPPADASLFKNMVRISKKYIAVFTDENINYDFVSLFQKLGCKLVTFKRFFGDDSIRQVKMPTELYDEKHHFFDSKAFMVFIKMEYMNNHE